MGDPTALVATAGKEWREMANPFVKGWKYLMAAFSSKIDENADPKVQLQQAIDDAREQHAALKKQAAAVIGNQRQLEMKLNRQMTQVEQLQSRAKQALTLADRAQKSGDTDEAAKYQQAAQSFATQLVSAEQQMDDLKTLHDQALQAAEKAKKAVDQNAQLLQQKLTERTKLMSQLNQAKMQEQIASSLDSMSDTSAPGTSPQLGEIRDKIERRYATALGASELSQDSPQGRMLDVEMSTMDMAGASKLDELRAQMNAELPAGDTAPALDESGAQGQQAQGQ